MGEGPSPAQACGSKQLPDRPTKVRSCNLLTLQLAIMPSPYPFPRMWQTVALHSNIRTKEQWPSNTDPSHAVHMIGSLVYAHEREPCNSAGGRIRRFFCYACRVSPRGGPAGGPQDFDAARNFWASKSATGSQHQASGEQRPLNYGLLHSLHG